MMIELTTTEIEFLKETLELVLEEFKGIEEYRDQLEDYILTTGAVEAAHLALVMVNQALRGRDESADYT